MIKITASYNQGTCHGSIIGNCSPLDKVKFIYGIIHAIELTHAQGAALYAMMLDKEMPDFLGKELQINNELVTRPYDWE